MSMKTTRESALAKYQTIMRNLSESKSPERFAQEANDAWLEYKRLDIDFKNRSILKTLGDSYGY